MRGIPEKISTRQDVINLVDILDPKSASEVVRQNDHLLNQGERAELMKVIGQKKRAQTRAENGARWRWERYHAVEQKIGLLEQENEDLMAGIRLVQAELASLRREKASLQKGIPV